MTNTTPSGCGWQPDRQGLNLRQTSILRKLLAYQTIWQSKPHQQQLGWHSFRVLFVTTSRERAENMVIAANKQTPAKGSPIFLFTDKQSLYSHDNLLAHEWFDCHGNRQRLLPPDIHMGKSRERVALKTSHGL